jgi:zinc transport system ATP-binding protein
VHMEQSILELLHALNDALPIVLVSHDLGFISTHVKRVACLNRRLVVHRPHEISREIIDSMYHSEGMVNQIRHRESCPIDEARREGGRAP